MQHLQMASNGEVTPEAGAAQLLEVVPLVMRTIRSHMRGHRAADLSVPQFRALAYVQRHAGASLSDVAEHLGQTLPATSRLVEGLVQRGYVTRAVASADRRAMELHVAEKGSAILDHTRQRTQLHLAALLASLTPDQRAQLVGALATLRTVFTSAPPAPAVRAPAAIEDSPL
jgi:DNA-binding MarR family transcriptional regulator